MDSIFAQPGAEVSSPTRSPRPCRRSSWPARSAAASSRSRQRRRSRRACRACTAAEIVAAGARDLVT